MKLIVPLNKPSDWQAIGCLNWENEFPYKPEVTFRVWHDGKYFHIEYKVKEESTKAEQTALGAPVYQDSCVECFIMPEGSTHYYNFEWNAAGKLAMARRTGRDDPQDAPMAVLESVFAKPSLGTTPFKEVSLEKEWTIEVGIPFSALFGDKLSGWGGQKMKMNFYKCGDGLKTMHFVTWAPICTTKPDYHRPEFFQEVEFE